MVFKYVYLLILTLDRFGYNSLHKLPDSHINLKVGKEKEENSLGNKYCVYTQMCLCVGVCTHMHTHAHLTWGLQEKQQ